jgi:hypothetical protein
MTDCAGIREEIAHVVPDRAGGELIEHVAEIRPWVEAMPVALAQTFSSTESVFNPPLPPTCSQLDRPIARGQMARSAAPLSSTKRASVRYRTRLGH